MKDRLNNKSLSSELTHSSVPQSMFSSPSTPLFQAEKLSQLTRVTDVQSRIKESESFIFPTFTRNAEQIATGLQRQLLHDGTNTFRRTAREGSTGSHCRVTPRSLILKGAAGSSFQLSDLPVCRSERELQNREEGHDLY